MGRDMAPTQLGLAQYKSLRVELEIYTGISVSEESGVYWEPELVTPSGIGPSLIIHPRFVHVAALFNVGWKVRTLWGHGESDKGSKPSRENIT